MIHSKINTLGSKLNLLNNMHEDFASFLILALIIIIVIAYISYSIYMTQLETKECNYLNTLYPSIDGNIKSISPTISDCSGNLYDYYIKTAFNACSGGSYKNDYVDICVLKSILKQGVRCLDFEIFNINNNPVVSSSTTNSYFVKETFNYVSFSDVMSTISNYAFSGGTVPNPTDPLIIHLRTKSNEQAVYTNLANIFKSYDKLMLGKSYSYENYGQNIAAQPLTSFMNKIILIVDKSNNAGFENKDFMEYVNLTSNSVFMRALSYYDVKNTPDINELEQFNQRCMTIVYPDVGTNPSNPSSVTCRAAGCQMVAMRYQYVDNYLEENAIFFDEGGFAFVLKPANLRYQEVTISQPTPQNPDYSYQTRNVTTDYYSFNY
jgi:hypothetical protein